MNEDLEVTIKVEPLMENTEEVNSCDNSRNCNLIVEVKIEPCLEAVLTTAFNNNIGENKEPGQCINKLVHNVFEELYENHEYKEDMVLGPELVQEYNIRKNDNTKNIQNRLTDSNKILQTSLEDNRIGNQLCHLCNRNLNNTRDFKKHMIEHSYQKKLTCCQCNKKYLYENNLLWHLMNRHSDQNKSRCHLCKKTFKSRPLLEKHILTHSMEIYSCDLCNEEFVYKTELVMHMKHHVGGSVYVCKYCQKEFEAPSGLLCHERTHTGHKPFCCEFCGDSFNRSSKLHRHIRQHTGEKPKKCKHCERKFIRHTDLDRHEKTHNS